MKNIKFNNVSPSGVKKDLFHLKEVRHSSKEERIYDIFYERLPWENKLFFGRVSMIQGSITFYDDKGNEFTEMTLEGLKQLCKWIEKHREIK